MFSQRARRAFSVMVAYVVVTIATATAASAAGDLFPDDNIDPESLGGFNRLFGNTFTAVSTVITALAGLMFLIYLFRTMRARSIDARQNHAIGALISLAVMVIIGSAGSVFSIAGEVGGSLFN